MATGLEFVMIISHGAQLLLTTTTRMTRYFISVPSLLIFSMRPFSFFPIFFPPIFLIFIFHLPHPVLLFLILITPSFSCSSSSPCLLCHPVFLFTPSSSSPPLLHPVFFTAFSSSPIFFLTPSSSPRLLLHPVFLLSEAQSILIFSHF